jgi:hypothetical protein
MIASGDSAVKLLWSNHWLSPNFCYSATRHLPLFAVELTMRMFGLRPQIPGSPNNLPFVSIFLIFALPFRSKGSTCAQGLPSMVRGFCHQGLEMTLYKRAPCQPYGAPMGIRAKDLKAQLSEVC